MATYRKRKKRWTAQVRRSGYPSTSKTFSIKRDAEIWAHEIERKMERGEDVSERPSATTTLGALLDKYLEMVTPHKKGASVEALRLGKIKRQKISSINIYRLRAVDAARYRDMRLAEVSTATVRKEMLLLNHVIEIARREWGFEIDNPMSLIRKPPEPQGRVRRLETGEEEKLLNALSESRNVWVEPLVRFALETAMRRGELLSLRWDDVDFSRRVIQLQETKNGKSRSVPLSTSAVSVLHRIRGCSSERVFPTTIYGIRCVWRAAVQRARIENLRFHDLRHEATSRLFEKGLNMMEVAAITGHRDLRMLQRYTHLRAEDLATKLV